MKMLQRKRGKTYPNIWKSGPDEVRHNLWIACVRAKAQAKYRGEEWLITPEEYIDLWMENDLYQNKGRGLDDYCLTRKDVYEPWSVENVEIITRREHFQTRDKKKYA